MKTLLQQTKTLRVALWCLFIINSAITFDQMNKMSEYTLFSGAITIAFGLVLLALNSLIIEIKQTENLNDEL